MTQTIVVIDDDSLMTVLTQRIFRSSDVEVVMAVDGEEGLRLVREKSPVAVVVDIHLPGSIHGWDVIDEMKADAALESIPIIVISAGTSEGDRDRAHNSGCVAYMVKPVSLDVLEDALKIYLS